MCCIISPISAHDGAALSPLFLSGMSREMSAQEGERERNDQQWRSVMITTSGRFINTISTNWADIDYKNWAQTHVQCLPTNPPILKTPPLLLIYTQPCACVSVYWCVYNIIMCIAYKIYQE